MSAGSRKRSRVFLSYSHKDTAVLEEFRPYLKSLADRGIIDFWIDQRLTPSDRWHDEIQAAMESAGAAVFLVSQDFLASDYIRRYEVPPLLRAREQDGLPVACLFIKPSLVSQAGMVFDAGSEHAVRLTDYQGLNSPERPLSAMNEHERLQTYKAAAEWIARVLAAPVSEQGFRQPAPEQRRELAIHLAVTGGHLVRTYFSAGVKITENRSLWREVEDRLTRWVSGGAYGAREDIGPTLFRVLFGDDGVSRTVLQALFGSAPGVEPRPVRHPVRVRIATREPLLGSLPWHRSVWEGERLWASAGWTFELVGGRPPAPGAEPVDVLLKAPCPVLLLGHGTHDPEGTDTHFRAVEERLHHAWPAYAEPPRVAWDGQALAKAFGERRPRIVYGVLHGPEPRLPAGPGDGSPGRPLAEALRAAWGGQPPQILFVNLVHDGPPQGVEALAELQGEVPLIILQSSPDAVALRASALDWLHALLESGEDADPVCALHAYAVERATVWGGYGRWRTRTAEEPPREKLAHLMLDRKLQRAVVRNALDELVHEGDRRLCCVFGYGAEGNRVDLLAQQLYEHLRRTARGVAQVRRVPLRLPQGRSDFDAAAVTAQVRRDLGLGPRDALKETLRSKRPRVGQGRRPLLFVDWGVRGDRRDPLGAQGVTAWLEFCAGPLCAECPPDLRLLSLLSLESPVAKHPRIEALVDGLRAESRFRDRAFRLELLEPLGRVTANDLADFLDRKGNASCPDDLVPSMPELIVGDTGGDFERTVARIEEAERRSWYALYDELARRVPVSATPAVLESDTL